MIMLKISPLEVGIENIEFSTCVREPVMKKIVVKNPLPEAAGYTVTTSSPYLMVESSFIVLPQEKYYLKVKYLPLKLENNTAVLTISNPTVGNYTYNLTLEARAPNSEPEVQFRTQLGQSVLKNINLPRVLQNSDVNAKITDNASFEVVRIQSQSEKLFIEVLFFPSKMGVIRAVLQLTSCVGDYTYPLVGESVPPDPQGPFSLNLGDSISIEINNPFEDTKIFQFSVDNRIFQVKPIEESIKAKKSTKITVSASSRRLSKMGSSSSIVELGKVGLLTAKLTVICENDTRWIYYLQCNSGNK